MSNVLLNVLVVQALPEVMHFLPFNFCQPIKGHGDRPNSYRVSKAESSSSRKTVLLQGQLGKADPGSVGAGSSTGVPFTHQPYQPHTSKTLHQFTWMELPAFSDSSMLLYADDLLLYHAIQDTHDFSRLQQDFTPLDQGK